MNASGPDTVVLIHGLWMTPLSWEHWVTYYEAAGMRVLTPGYPGIEPGEAGVAALREDPSPLACLGVADIVDHLSAIIADLPNQPIIMGHSFGGAFVQLLLDAGLGAAGVSINGVGVKGVLKLPLSQIKSAFPVLKNPANRDRAVPITPAELHHGFTNNLSVQESQQVYDRYVIPASGRLLFQAGFANLVPGSPMTVNFANNARAPLLFVAGSNDHLLPPTVQRDNYAKHATRSGAITAYKEFDGRCHYTCGEPGWEAVADYALAWARNPREGELA